MKLFSGRGGADKLFWGTLLRGERTVRRAVPFRAVWFAGRVGLRGVLTVLYCIQPATS